MAVLYITGQKYEKYEICSRAGWKGKCNKSRTKNVTCSNRIWTWQQQPREAHVNPRSMLKAFSPHKDWHAWKVSFQQCQSRAWRNNLLIHCLAGTHGWWERCSHLGTGINSERVCNRGRGAKLCEQACVSLLNLNMVSKERDFIKGQKENTTAEGKCRKMKQRQ